MKLVFQFLLDFFERYWLSNGDIYVTPYIPINVNKPINSIVCKNPALLNEITGKYYTFDIAHKGTIERMIEKECESTAKTDK